MSEADRESFFEKLNSEIMNVAKKGFPALSFLVSLKKQSVHRFPIPKTSRSNNRKPSDNKRNYRFTAAHVDTDGNTVYFYMSNSLIYIPEIHRRSFKHSARRRNYGK